MIRMAMIGWNGTLLMDKDAVIPVGDHGFLYGLSLFETMRTYKGQPFRLEQHLERLHEGCRALGIKLSLEAEPLRMHIKEVMHANGLEEAYIRLTVSAGEQGVGLPTGDYLSPTVIVLAKPLPDLPSSLYEQGKPLQLLRIRRNTPEGEIRFKSGHYMNNILAKRELMQYESAKLGAEGLLFTAEGDAAEGIVSNIFAISEHTLFTPPIHTGILPGITRAVTIEIAKQLGIPVAERTFGREMLLHECDELFITTSVQELVPITAVWDEANHLVQVGSGKAGPLTIRLLEAYRSIAWKEAQVDENR